MANIAARTKWWDWGDQLQFSTLPGLELNSQDSLGGGEIEEEQPEPQEAPVVLIHEDKEEWEMVIPSKKRQIKRKRFPVVAVRKSNRMVTPREPSATQITSAVAGNSNSSNSCFRILNSCDEEDLENIAAHCDVMLGGG